MEVHNFVIQSDLDTINSQSDEGEPVILMTVLDLNHWTRIFEASQISVDLALERVRELHGAMTEILTRDQLEIDECTTQTTLAETAIKGSNASTWPSDFGGNPCQGLNHPYLKNVRLAEGQRAALEDFSDEIQSSQAEIDQNSLVASGRNLSVPFVPPRSVEDQVAVKDHRVWTLGNVNLLAPITGAMMRVWAGLDKSELEGCKSHAQNGTQCSRAPENLLKAFSLSQYEHSKCPTLPVKVHLKNPLPTAGDRKEKHPQEMWNVKRPYLRCTCDQNATNGCNGAIIWFDHAMWYMINHLERFFPDTEFPSLSAKFLAFIIWSSSVARTAYKWHMTFTYTRLWMKEGILQYAQQPQEPLFSKYPDLPGFRYIERLLKPPSFSIANPGTPSLGPGGKRQKLLNLNTTPPVHRLNPGGSRGRGGYSRGRGGGRNQAFRGRFSPTPRNYVERGSPSTPRHQVPAFGSHQLTGSLGQPTTLSHSDRGTSMPEQSPIRAKILSFDEDI